MMPRKNQMMALQIQFVLQPMEWLFRPDLSFKDNIPN
jgi:hypothetical protein